MIKGLKGEGMVLKNQPNLYTRKHNHDKQQTPQPLYTFYYLPTQNEEKISPSKASEETGLVISPRAV